jgi:hypothetical protein
MPGSKEAEAKWEYPTQLSWRVHHGCKISVSNTYSGQILANQKKVKRGGYII